MQEQSTALVKEQYLPTQNILRIREQGKDRLNALRKQRQGRIFEIDSNWEELTRQANLVHLKTSGTGRTSNQEVIGGWEGAAENTETALTSGVRRGINNSIFKIAEGGAPETPTPAAINMAGNNNEYFYDNARNNQEEYDDDDFWGAPEPGRLKTYQ